MHPVLKTVRRGEYRNPTTIHGSVVHAYSNNGDTLVRCGMHMRSVVYSSEPVNCPKCQEAVMSMDTARLTAEVDKAASAIYELSRVITPEMSHRLVNSLERIALSLDQAAMSLDELAGIAKANAKKTG